MSPETLLAFAMFALVGSVTPGPNNIMLTAIGASFGVVRGLPALLGVTFGYSFMVAVVAFGLGSVITANPGIMTALKVAGILMLLWLSWKIATAPVTVDMNAPDNEKENRPVGFLTAAALQWVNPKGWLVAVSAASTYFVADASALSQATTFAAVFLAAAIPACSLWLAFGAAAGKLLNGKPEWTRAFNYTMAALLLSSIWLMVS